MWLLSTSRAELKLFHSPSKVPSPGFAILSHTWGDNEQTFQDLQRIIEQCKNSGKNPRDFVSEKIRQFCKIAEAEGYAWAWADTCCIDKTSSAELTEAINSMFRYYRLSGVCLVYLEDVHDLPVPRATPPSRIAKKAEASRSFERQFDKCRWRRRGWTLQELIAPRFVVLLSSSWKVLGSKADLSVELSRATGIPAGLLRLEQKLEDYSIAQRMSWAALRETTREEDEAYCLLGIFNIYMPTLYGEGRNAFRRLQEEIMRTNPDTTLFAWGQSILLSHLKETAIQARYPLFAGSTRDFLWCQDITYDIRRRSMGPAENPSFTLTPYGIRARALLTHVDGCALLDLALTDDHLATSLFLHVRADTSSSTNSLYSVIGGTHSARLCIFDKAVSRKPAWKMTEMWLTSPLPESDTVLSENTPSRYLSNRSLFSPFRFYAPTDDTTSPYTILPLQTFHEGLTYLLRLSLKSSLGGLHDIQAQVLLGTCMRSSRTKTIHWARAYRHSALQGADDHICEEDHIRRWPNYTRTMAIHIRDWERHEHDCGTVRLRFTQSVLSEYTMILQEIQFTPKVPPEALT